MLVYSLVLIPMSLMPTFLAMSGNIYLWGALALGAVLAYSGLRVVMDRTRQHARQVLLASVIYLPLLYTLMVFDRPA